VLGEAVAAERRAPRGGARPEGREQAGEDVARPVEVEVGARA